MNNWSAMESCHLRRTQVFRQTGLKAETQRGNQMEEKEKYLQVKREKRSVQQETETRPLTKQARVTLHATEAQAAGQVSREERLQDPLESHARPPTGEAKASGKSVCCLELCLNIRDHQHTCKEQLFNLISWFCRFLSGNLSAEGKKWSQELACY